MAQRQLAAPRLFQTPLRQWQAQYKQTQGTAEGQTTPPEKSERPARLKRRLRRPVGV